ncbi:MAG: right-handed parallel beta-helix repeat-containing protein, partial [Phycisphaeraceae bacterium]|nr:right-handed parallel beta-helix repeat-containing protein [Phycisphaeraceae bacterium]
GLESTDPVKTTPASKLVDAGRFLDRGDAQCGLQKALDALGPGGGVVTIPPGRYLMRAGLTLPSRVTLRSTGGGVTLVASKPELAHLMISARAGADTVEVDDPAVFRVGDAVSIRDAKMGPWEATTTTVQSIRSQSLWLSRPLARDCNSNDDAVVIHQFAMISAIRHRSVTIEGIGIEGSGDGWPGSGEPGSQAHGGAVLLLECEDSAVSQCRVDGWPGDGISVQGGRDVTVRDCAIRGNLGHGVHLSLGAKRLTLRGNRALHNAGDGLFAGERVRDSLVEACVLAGNAGCGIGGIEDQAMTLALNQCHDNGRHGIEIRGGSGHVATGNTCRDNGRALRADAPAAGILLRDTARSLVHANQCISDATPACQRWGIREEDSCEGNVIEQNICARCELSRRRGSADAPAAPAAESASPARSRFRRGLEDF